MPLLSDCPLFILYSTIGPYRLVFRTMIPRVKVCMYRHWWSEAHSPSLSLEVISFERFIISPETHVLYWMNEENSVSLVEGRRCRSQGLERLDADTIERVFILFPFPRPFIFQKTPDPSPPLLFRGPGWVYAYYLLRGVSDDKAAVHTWSRASIS